MTNEEPWPLDYVAMNRRSYDALAEQYRARISADRLGDSALVRPFVDMVRPLGKVPLVIDVGCGAGLNVSMFAESGFRSVGLDISRPMLNIAKELTPTASFVEADIRTPPFAGSTFHGVFAKAIIHLFPKAHAIGVLATIRSLLVPRGVIYVTTTVDHGPGSGFSPKYDYRGSISRYRRTWSASELLQAVEGAGFDVVLTSHDVEHERSKNWFNVWALSSS